MNEKTSIRPEEASAAERLKDLLRYEGQEEVSWEPGTNIYAFGPGDCFQIAPLMPDQVTPAGNAHSDIAAVQEESLDYALADKARKMAPLSRYQRKAPVLINRYFFGDDPGEAQRLLKKLMPSYGIFDFVFLFEANRGLSLVYTRPSSAV